MMIKKKSQTGRANGLNLCINPMEEAFRHMEPHLPTYGRTPSDVWNHMFPHMGEHLPTYGTTCSDVWENMFRRMGKEDVLPFFLKNLPNTSS